ncbi:MAG: DNA-deoxyinosine glycosylase [Acutalibacteraceae bacterium]
MAAQKRERVVHTLPPLYDAQSRVLILGTMPSPKSREYGFYYAHPQNRFWKTLAAVFEEEVPQTNEKRAAFVRAHHIALWDVLASCDIAGAEDSSIANPVPNDLFTILNAADIRGIFTTGQKAFALYRKLLLPSVKREAILLPSTSPANCRWYTETQLVEAYRAIAAYTAL